MTKYMYMPYTVEIVSSFTVWNVNVELFYITLTRGRNSQMLKFKENMFKLVSKMSAWNLK